MKNVEVKRAITWKILPEATVFFAAFVAIALNIYFTFISPDVGLRASLLWCALFPFLAIVLLSIGDAQLFGKIGKIASIILAAILFTFLMSQSYFPNLLSFGGTKYHHNDRSFIGMYSTTGIAKIVYPNGDIYEGEITKNSPNGQGKLICADGYIYEGNFSNNKMDGLFKVTPLEGTALEVEYQNGERIESRLTDNPVNTYTAEQLQALGTVMVCADTVLFNRNPEGKKDIRLSIGVITFVDETLHFAALGHNAEIMSDRGGRIYDTELISDGIDGREYAYDLSSDNYIDLDDGYNTIDGFFGKMGDYSYNPAKEMQFGIPTMGAAQIYLERPDNQSGWYEITIEGWVNDSLYTSEDGCACVLRLTFQDFVFVFNDARLPADFGSWELAGLSGSPIIQAGKLVGAFSATLPTGDNVANLAADMRFIQLERYAEDFNADLFRDVSQLWVYFD